MKTVSVLSGGIDSTVLLYSLVDAGHEVYPISFNYGQRHVRELDFAARTCQRLRLPHHQVVDLSGLKQVLRGSSLTDDSVDVPDGHYAEESMKQTVVPNRNMIMLSVAVGYAISLQAESVAYGAHSGDHTIYPDCREEFAEALDHAIQLCDWHAVRLDRPFVTMNKAEIVMLGHKLGVDFNDTWSCYRGDDIHCGSCGTCVERFEAFRLAGLDDPTLYTTDPSPYLNHKPK